MTDAQLTLILTGLGTLAVTIGGAIKWAVGRITRALDENTEALSDFKVAAATHAQALQGIAGSVQHVAEWCDAHTNVGELPDGIRTKSPQRAATPPRGLPVGQYHVRARTRNDDE